MQHGRKWAFGSAIFLGVPLLLCCAMSIAAPRAGEYVTEHGWGRLTITSQPGKGLGFKLRSSGANGHSCGLGGAIAGQDSTLPTPWAGEKAACVVRFTETARGLEVSSPNTPACHGFCGMRAWFNGEYLAVPKTCERANQRKARDRFLSLYRKKDYAGATEALRPLGEQCASFLSLQESARDANDMAVALFHMGDLGSCVRILEPVLDALSDEEIALAGRTAPSDHEWMAGLAKTSRYNSMRCRQERP